MPVNFSQIASAPNRRLHRPTKTTILNGYNVVPDDPMALAKAAGISDINTYALARAVASEAGNAAPEEMLMIAEAIRNKARAAGVSIMELVTSQKKRPDVTGKFGEQHGRYVATSKDPTFRTLEAAKMAINEGTDAVQGATHWIHTKVQSAGKQAGRAIRGVDEIIERRRKDGLDIYDIPGVDKARAIFFGPRGKQSAGGAPTGEAPLAQDGALPVEQEHPLPPGPDRYSGGQITAQNLDGGDEQVNPWELPGKLKQGYTIKDPQQKIPTVWPDGWQGTVPVGNLDKAMEYGAYIPQGIEDPNRTNSPQDVPPQSEHPFIDKLDAFGNAMADSVTLGGYGLARNYLAPQAEKDRAAELAHEYPTATVAGEIAGYAIPGAGAAKVGKGAMALAGKRLGPFAARVVGGAAEGAAIGAAQPIAEELREPDPLDWEKLASDLPTSIATGGALGSVFGLTSATIGAGAKALGKLKGAYASREAIHLATEAGKGKLMEEILPGSNAITKMVTKPWARDMFKVVEGVGKRTEGGLHSFIQRATPVTREFVGAKNRAYTYVGIRSEDELSGRNNFHKQQEEIMSMVDSPGEGQPYTVTEEGMNRLDVAMTDVNKESPEMANTVKETVARRYEYLANALPKGPPQSLGKKPWSPPRIELERFNRQLRVAENPLSIMDRIERGSLTPDEVKTMSTIYPEMYRDMSTAMLAAMGEQKKIPYWKRLQVSIFLDAPIDGTLHPEIIRMTQKMHDFEALKKEEAQMKEPLQGQEDPTSAQRLAMTEGM